MFGLLYRQWFLNKMRKSRCVRLGTDEFEVYVKYQLEMLAKHRSVELRRGAGISNPPQVDERGTVRREEHHEATMPGGILKELMEKRACKGTKKKWEEK